MEQIEFSRTVVPSSMRSPYWKYFGFPSDSSNNILTRQKIVCTICNNTITYNKNTSNLRTHLMSKHVEIFKKIVTPNTLFDEKQNTFSYQDTKDLKDLNCDKQSVCVKLLNTKRQCIEIVNDGYEGATLLQNEKSLLENCLTLPQYKNIGPESTNRENISGFSSNKLDFQSQSADFIAYFPSNDPEIEETTSNSELLDNGNEDYAINNDLNEEQDVQLQSMYVMLADFIQTDLLPLDTLEENGFCKYNQQLTGLKIDAETITQVKGVIETRFANVKKIVSSHVNRLSESGPYSLSFEIYKDYDDLYILNIYFNYLSDKLVDLISILYTSCAIYTKAVNISELLSDINLKNCSGIVLTCMDNELQFISDFAKLHDLPLVECLESMLSRCLQKIFEKTGFNVDYKQFLKTILEMNDVTRLKKSNFRSQCKWSILIFLEYLFNNVEQSKNHQWAEFRRDFEYLKPLKMALDVIMDEPLPLCSLSQPLIKKLFEKHFNLINRREPRKTEFQNILQKELYERVMTRNFLNEVTFFDTRFHREFTVQDPHINITWIKNNVTNRFKHILQVTSINMTNNFKMKQVSMDSCNNVQKFSSLKSFFKPDVSLLNTDVTTNVKTNLDLEFQQYYAEACLDLDQSALLWWEQKSDNYKQLSKIAKIYLTIPCCCLPRFYRFDLEQRYLKLDRRKSLSQFCSTESKLWFLNYNGDVADLSS